MLEATDPHLHMISTPVKTIDGGSRTLLADMFKLIYDALGIGLGV